MVEPSSIATLREALRGEQSQLESWVCESLAAMDALHGELSDWQRELARQQAQLDQREAGLTAELRELRRLMESQGATLLRLNETFSAHIGRDV